jgi:PPP family 3-phenylpropionic acid transporter
MASVFFFSAGMNTSTAFGFVYFQHELGAENALIGVIASVAALAEIPAMLLIDRLLRRVDIRLTLATGIAGLALTWYCYALLKGPALLIPLMIVRGTFYTLHTVSITLLVNQISHPANAATNQAIAQTTVPGLAVLLTGTISGWIFDHLGARALFQIAGFIGVMAAVLLFAARQHLTPAGQFGRTTSGHEGVTTSTHRESALE